MFETCVLQFSNHVRNVYYWNVYNIQTYPSPSPVASYGPCQTRITAQSNKSLETQDIQRRGWLYISARNRTATASELGAENTLW